MKQTIKRYAELKKLIGQGKTVTLDGRAMNNDKVNAMRMIEVQTAIKDEQFKVEAIEGEFIGKDEREVNISEGPYDQIAQDQARMIAEIDLQAKITAEKAAYYHGMQNQQMQAAIGGIGAGNMGANGILGGFFGMGI